MQSSTTYTGLSPIDSKPVDITVADGKIISVAPSQGSPSSYIAPGLIDVQVNGFAAVDYNSPDTPLDEIARSIEVQRRTGVTRLLPTVITGSNENIRGSLANLAKAARELDAGRSIECFHVEGPWIAGEDGPRGAHPKQHVRGPSIEEFKQFQDAAEGRIRLLTLAPEWPGSTEVIEYMVDQGVTVAIGHTAASEEDIRNAIAAGATMSTHLGNGAHSTIPRHSNYINYQLAADELMAGLIVDGIHLPPAFVKIAVRTKGLERIVLVTDAAPPAGSEPGIYVFGHLEVELTPDQSVRLTDSGRLAGSALSMDRGVENLMRFAGLTLEQALRAGTERAALAVHMDDRRGFLEAGDAAELFLFDFDADDQSISVRETILA